MLCALPVWEWSMQVQLFDESAHVHGPCGLGPVPAEAALRLRSLGLQRNLDEGLETGMVISPPSPTRSSALSQGSEARSVFSSPPE